MANKPALCGSSLKSYRFVYNSALAINTQRYEKKEKPLIVT
jgi:hypothetical protein